METPYYLREGRSLYHYVGQSGTVEAVTANQERREKLARYDMLETYENSIIDETQDFLG